MGVKLAAALGGSVELVPTNTASNYTITLPASTSTVLTTTTAGIAISGPTFSAYQSSAQTLSGATWTKLQFQTEEWDTAGAFDSTTNYRFQPTVAGYYVINGGFQVSLTQTTCLLQLYKNGGPYKSIGYIYYSQSGTYGSGQVYLNGSTDYVELYGYITGGQPLSAGSAITYFQGSMVRAA